MKLDIRLHESIAKNIKQEELLAYFDDLLDCILRSEQVINIHLQEVRILKQHVELLKDLRDRIVTSRK